MLLLLPWLAAPAQAQQQAQPAPVVIWVEATLPEEKLVRKVARLSGGEPQQYTGANLAFPPSPWQESDTRAYADLARAIEGSNERFDEFDVELSIAQELTAALEPISVIRNEEDRAQVVAALTLLGAAVELAFSEADLANSGDAQDLRLELPGMVANKALLSAAVLEPDRSWVRSDLRTGSSYKDLLSLVEALPSMAKGSLMTGELPDGTQLVVDGRPTEIVGGKVELSPGHHWVHVVVDGLITGRGEVDIFPGTPVEMPRLVDDRELAQADRRVSVGASDGLPEDVSTAIEQLSQQHPGAPVYLASLDPEGKVSVVPFSDNAVLHKPQVVTFTLGAEVGGGGVGTAAFRFTDPNERNSDGTMLFAPAAQGAFDMELGIYNLAIVGGAEVNITPTRSLAYGVEGQLSASENLDIPIYVKAYGGLGIYVLRPNQQGRPTLLLAGNYGFFSPGWQGYGGRMTMGIPMGTGNWFKVTLHGWTSEPLKSGQDSGVFPADTTLVNGGLRVGFQSSF
jgi:hypothetical protein